MSEKLSRVELRHILEKHIWACGMPLNQFGLRCLPFYENRNDAWKQVKRKYFLEDSTHLLPYSVVQEIGETGADVMLFEHIIADSVLNRYLEMRKGRGIKRMTYFKTPFSDELQKEYDYIAKLIEKDYRAEQIDQIKIVQPVIPLEHSIVGSSKLGPEWEEIHKPYFRSLTDAIRISKAPFNRILKLPINISVNTSQRDMQLYALMNSSPEFIGHVYDLMRSMSVEDDESGNKVKLYAVPGSEQSGFLYLKSVLIEEVYRNDTIGGAPVYVPSRIIHWDCNSPEVALWKSQMERELLDVCNSGALINLLEWSRFSNELQSIATQIKGNNLEQVPETLRSWTSLEKLVHNIDLIVKRISPEKG